MKTTLPRAALTALDVGKYCIVQSANDRKPWCGRVVAVGAGRIGSVRIFRIGTSQERTVFASSVLAWEDSPEFREWMANDRD